MMNKDRAIQMLERMQNPEPYDPQITSEAFDALSADGDTISRAKAIDVIEDELDKIDHVPQWVFDRLTNRVRDLPSAQPDVPDTNVGDTISRQAVFDVLDNIKIPRNASWYPYYQQALTAVSKLPPAQQEIIRCGECKHRDPEDRKCDCGHDILWQLPRQDDWYCADAERRAE